MKGRALFDDVGGLWRLSKKIRLCSFCIFTLWAGTKRKRERKAEIERMVICVGSRWVGGWRGSSGISSSFN